MRTRANWHTDELPDLDEYPDPFAAPVEEVGERIDLTDPRDRLNLRLTELLAGESALARNGVTCAIKDRVDTCCSACPVSKALDREDPLGVLCRCGREQERVATELGTLLIERCEPEA